MKQIVSFFTIIALIISMASPALCSTNWVSLGYKDNCSNISAGFRDGNFGLDVGLIFTDEEYQDVTDGIPDGVSYTSVGEVAADEWELCTDVLWFYDISEKTALYLGPGVMLKRYKEIVKDNDTGKLYARSAESKIEVSGSVGVKCTLNDSVGIGFGYHTEHGVNVQVVWGF